MLVPVGAANKGVALDMTFISPWDGTETAIPPPMILNAADKQFPLADGDVVFRIAKAARERDESEPESFRMNGRPVFFICLWRG